jgi:AcrR family transcriptional regulator
MNASQPAREQTRAALLDAAERILIESGYPAATTRAIAAEANVNHGLIHY